MRPIWTADAETDPFKRNRVPKPFIWGLWDIENEEYYQFEKTKDFVEFIAEKEIIVYAHNGGKFDWHFITDYIADFEPLTIIAGRLAKFKIGNCEFRDSYNIIPAPLSAYQKDEIDYNIFEKGEREKPENWEKITAYLKTDCIYLGELVSNFIEDYGFCLTQASAAMKYWSKLTKTKKPQSNEHYYDRFAQFYYGGRVECFETGIIAENFSVVDINSAYPFAMMSNHPWGQKYMQEDEIDYLNDKQLGPCFISMKADSLGAFPFREKDGLQFPNDGLQREFHITGWEYIAARDTGALKNVEIDCAYIFLDSINFSQYVDHFFNMKNQARKDGDKARYLFAKLFLNSLYGKFASNPENYQEFMTLPAKYLAAAEKEDDWDYCKMISNETAVVSRQLLEEKRRYYDVAVSASITGFVRAYLWKNICKAKGVLYCDTDSIAARNINGIPLSNKLGDWDLEAQCDYAAIGGKKLYAFQKKTGTYNEKTERQWKTASKGVRLDHNEIVKVAKGEEINYIPEAPTFSIKQGIRFTPRKIRMIKK